MTDKTRTPHAVSTHHLLGLRTQPGRLALRVFRLPLPIYRSGRGWLLGRTFVAITHVGRRTGAPHLTTAMVLRYDARTQEVVVCSAWGPDADWVRNLRAHPALRVQLGKDTFAAPQHRFLTNDEAVDVVVAFRHRHPWRTRFVCRVLDWGDLSDDDAIRAFVATRPFLAFRPGH